MVGYGWVWLGMVGYGWTWLDMVGIWLGYGWMCSHVFLTIANQKLPTTPNLKSFSKGLKHTISNINEYGNINHGRRRRRRRRCGM
jgi:fatty acid desaturase